MESLAILNRLSIFCNDANERVELCSALEREAETMNPADVPLSALDTAVGLMSDNSGDVAIIKCTCAFLSTCALGDSQVVRKYLLQLAPLAGFTAKAREGVSSDALPFCVASINKALDACVVSSTRIGLYDWKVGVQPLTDLIATLGYNNGTFRTFFGMSVGSAPSTLQLLAKVLARVRLEDRQGHTLTTGSTAAITSDFMTNPIASALFYTVSCTAVLLMTDSRNSSEALALGLVAEVLHCYKCLHVAGTSLGALSRRPGSAAAGPKGRIGGTPEVVSETHFGPPTRYSFANADAKAEIGKWCVQVLRNASIAAPSHPSWEGIDKTATRPGTASFEGHGLGYAVLDFGRMGEIIAVDELKWELSKLRKKYASS